MAILVGRSIIGFRDGGEACEQFYGVNPANGQRLQPAFSPAADGQSRCPTMTESKGVERAWKSKVAGTRQAWRKRFPISVGGRGRNSDAKQRPSKGESGRSGKNLDRLPSKPYSQGRVVELAVTLYEHPPQRYGYRDPWEHQRTRPSTE